MQYSDVDRKYFAPHMPSGFQTPQFVVSGGGKFVADQKRRFPNYETCTIDSDKHRRTKERVNRFIADKYPDHSLPRRLDLVVLNDLHEHLSHAWSGLLSTFEFLNLDGRATSSISNVRNNAVINPFRRVWNFQISRCRFVVSDLPTVLYRRERT